jgi:hypothetical protein
MHSNLESLLAQSLRSRTTVLFFIPGSNRSVDIAILTATIAKNGTVNEWNRSTLRRLGASAVGIDLNNGRERESRIHWHWHWLLQPLANANITIPCSLGHTAVWVHAAVANVWVIESNAKTGIGFFALGLHSRVHGHWQWLLNGYTLVLGEPCSLGPTAVFKFAAVANDRGKDFNAKAV